MSDLTPPADAPLPWTFGDPEHQHGFVIDANCNLVAALSPDDKDTRYLVAAANAAPGLVAERDALREMNAAWSQWCQSQPSEESQRRLSDAKDALAAVQHRQPVPVGVASVAASPLAPLEAAIRTLDKETPMKLTARDRSTNNDAVVFVDDDISGAITYLVSAANAAPGLVARMEALDIAIAQACRSRDDARNERDIKHVQAARYELDRDTALARVAELEAQLAKQAPVVEAARRQAETFAAFCLANEDENDDRPWLAVLAASRFTESAIRTLDKETT